MASNILLDNVELVCHRLTEEIFPEELEVFSDLWDVVAPYFQQWQMQLPGERALLALDFTSFHGLGFSEVASSALPIAFSAAFATLLDIWEGKEGPTKSAVVSTVRKYAQGFGASEGLQRLLEEKVPVFCLEMYQEMENKGLFEEQAKAASEGEQARLARSRKAYAKMWTASTDDAENGEAVSKGGYDKIVKKKKHVPLLIVKRKGFRDTFVYGDRRELSPLLFDLLEYVLKHQGIGGDALNLLGNVWGEKDTMTQLRRELDMARESGKGEWDIQGQIKESTGRIGKTVNELNKFLEPELGVKLETRRTGQYRIWQSLEYFLVEIT